jgi:hypothetical protein
LFPAGAQVVSADAFLAVDRPDRLELEVLDPGGGRAELLPRSQVDFWLGERRLFSGVLERSGMRRDRHGGRLSLVAYAPYEMRRRRMASDRYCDRYYQMSDAEIAARIARELGLVARVEATREVHRRIERRGDPLRFLRQRALEEGCELGVSGGALYFVRRLSRLAGAGRVLRLGEGVVGFEVEDRGERGTRGEVEIQGDPGWQPLLGLDLRGAGPPWDGAYLVIRCRHQLDGSGYVTVLEFARENGNGQGQGQGLYWESHDRGR